MKKKFILMTLVGILTTSIFTGCGASGDKKADGGAKKEYSENIPESIRTDEDGVKIMVIRKIGGDDHTAQFLAGAKAEGESMGFQVDTFSANGDTAKFHDAINQVEDKGYDGVVISHGDDETTVSAIEKLTKAGIPVVTFDSNTKVGDVDGVTVTSQDDAALAKLALGALKEQTGSKGNIGYLWVDGFPPMVARNKVYTEFMKENNGYKEIDRYGSANGDVSVQTQNAVTAMLTKHKEGELDAIFATWDAFAIGASRAIKEAGRDDLKLVGIDVSNADLQAMQEEGSQWVATAACDPKLIGSVNVRLLAKKIAGEKTPEEYKVEASLIKQEDLKKSKEPVNMENLGNIIEGWGKSDEFLEDWMNELKETHK